LKIPKRAIGFLGLAGLPLALIGFALDISGMNELGLTVSILGIGTFGLFALLALRKTG
jgi:hypothetical protein